MRESSLATRKPIITVREARKLLGKRSVCLTNEEVSSIVNDYEQLARLAIRLYSVRN
jgi:hypothetical protein